MMQFFNYNNKLFRSDRVALKINNRAFAYGDGVFETMRFQNDRILFLEDHWKRLVRGLKFLNLKRDDSFTKETVEQQVRVLCAENKVKQARVRMEVFRNPGGYYTPKVDGISWCIALERLEFSYFVLNIKGLRMEIADEWRLEKNQVSNLKTLYCLPYIKAGISARDKNMDDALILNTDGTIAEAVSSNIFIVKTHQVFTPPITDGCKDGVMRKQIISICNSANLKITEKSLSAEDVSKADELFLTNVINGITWVEGFRGKHFKNTYAKVFTEKLNVLVNPEPVPAVESSDSGSSQ